MRPRPMLLIAAAVLAVVHVIGVLFARPLWRPAEVVAALCLLAYTIGAGSWVLTAAAGVLVAGAALTVPEPGGDAGMQVLSPEQYTSLFRQDQLETLTRVTAALLFVLLLLVVAVLRRPAPGRAVLGAAAVAALLIIGYAVVRSVVILSAGPRPTETSWSLGVGAVLPLLLALAALALAVAAAANRRWRAAAGAVLFVAVAVIFLDAAVGAVALPYEVRDYAQLFALDLITATDAVPQPTLALTVALQLTAAILAVAGLSARR
ncbi:hypothetical protein [Actinoplanes sp. NPDC049599]|uniref:hypothetical protein n=1 Tax=Actinoplanes sp. NPDC049599 TaxID=3363903 RepID=UPI00379B4A60